MNDKLLTICIPTYNRKEQLLQQLSSLYSQKEISKVDILVIDNHSDYDVYSAIVERFGIDNISNLTVHKNPVNFGLEPNILMPFLLAKTKWIWTLGDDDETTNDSISIILDNILKNKDVAYFIFSITNFPPHNNNKYDTLDAFIEYWYREHKYNGDLVFLSNKVYNLDFVKPYIGLAFKNCLNCVGHIVPILYGLNDKRAVVQMCSKSIVTYNEPDPSSKWSYIKIALEFSLVSYMDFNISKKSFDHFCCSFGRAFHDVSFINQCLNFSPRYKGKFIFFEVYNKLLIHKGLMSKLSIFVFYFCYYFHINYNSAIPFLRKVWKQFSK